MTEKRPLDIDSGDISLTLKRSSWENLFRVLKWTSPCELSKISQEIYLQETGEHWTLGNFWASIHHLDAQFEEKSPEQRRDSELEDAHGNDR